MPFSAANNGFEHSPLHTHLHSLSLTHTHTQVCHAEMNAILNKNSADVKGCTMYVALFPCNECAKLIIQSSIAEVVYVGDKYRDKPEMKASRRLLNMAGVKCRYHIIIPYITNLANDSNIEKSVVCLFSKNAQFF